MNVLTTITAIEREWYGVLLAFVMLCLVLSGVDITW